MSMLRRVLQFISVPDRYAIVVCGIFVHAVLLVAVFDIYFQSPVLHGIAPIVPLFKPPAKRAVLFLSDGLRADRCFSARTADDKWAAPFLRSVAETKGVWGVSHTRVPTESRPGCVALVAGFYEDVSAITRGWKENPVNFDTVFNESRYSWCWGSPDTIQMFSKGAMTLNRSHIFFDHYSQMEVDFGNNNPSSLDTWVLHRFEVFLNEARRNETLAALLSLNKIIFFFHLLGADISGHSRKPWSEEYVTTIEVVDGVVEKIESLLKEYYKDDNETAYIFTADHGMTDWGSHGSSSVEETETPLLAWGAGIRKPIFHPMTTSSKTSNWDLSHVTHTDIQQGDVAPLLATLVGIPIPVNSVSVVPIDLLSCEESFCMEALLTNARQLSAQFEKHWDIKESNSFSVFFRPYTNLNRSYLLTTLEELEVSLKVSWNDLAGVQTKSTAKEILKLTEALITGIRYFETYDRVPLSISVILGFLGWMNCVFIHLIESISINASRVFRRPSKLSFTLVDGIFVLWATISVIISFSQMEPFVYLIYRLLPVVTWTYVFHSDFGTLREILFYSGLADIVTWMKHLLTVVIGVELLVFTFYKRGALSIGLIIFSVWPFTTTVRQTHMEVIILWTVVSLAMSTFSTMPPLGLWVNYGFVVFAGIVYLLVTVFVVVKYKSMMSQGRKLILLQICLMIGVLVNKVSVAVQRRHGNNVDPITRASSWIFLVISNILPFYQSTFIPCRLLSLLTSLVSSYLIVSFSFEALLFVCFINLMALWLIVEYYLMPFSRVPMKEFDFVDVYRRRKSVVPYGFTLDDMRLSYFCLFFMVLAFFGMANEANVNSFTLDSVFGFVTVFSPFIMAALLLFKIVIPFLVVACCIRAINVVRDQPSSHLFYCILLLSDIMALHFFFLIRDEGSWLDIGISLGHFVTAIVSTIGFCFLYAVASLLTSFRLSSYAFIEND